MNFQQILEKYLPLVSNMLVASLIFAAALFTFLLKENFDFSVAVFFHWSFYFLSVVNIAVLLSFNHGENLFTVTAVLFFYIIINVLKNNTGVDFEQTAAFQNLKALVPLNILLFYKFPVKKFVSLKSYLYLCAILVEYSICEFLNQFSLTFEIKEYGIPLFETLGYLILFTCILIPAIRKGELHDYTALFCSMSIWCGLYFAERSSALSLFFCITQLLLSIEIFYTFIYNYFYDETGVYSRNSYFRQAKSLPQKYAFGIIKIDNYKQLLRSIGYKNQKTMDQLIVNLIQDMATEALIYRYTLDTFILIYKKLDKKELFKEIDGIRHRIAGVFFEYAKNKKAVKLTISCSVTEKKRSDAGVENVFLRADEKMQKTLKFSHNITVMA